MAVADGETVLSPDVQRNLAGAIRERNDVERPVLTPREHGVLALAAEGLSTREIAARLNVASATVKTHLQSIYSKLEVPDRTSAVRIRIYLADDHPLFLRSIAGAIQERPTLELVGQAQ